MPWTFSHPAIVIPIAKLSKNKFPAIGLIIGSCSPDFGYYVQYWNLAAASHNFANSLYIALPICLALIAIFIFLKEGILKIAPPTLSHFLKHYIPDKKVPSFLDIAFMVFAIIIGIYSHIIWDSFTHNPKYFKDWWPFIGHSLSFFGEPIPIFKILQYTSSLFGVILMLYWFKKSYDKSKTTQFKNYNHRISWQLKYILGISILSGVMSVISYAFRFKIQKSEIHHFLFINTVQSTMILFCIIIITVIILQIYSIYRMRNSHLN